MRRFGKRVESTRVSLSRCSPAQHSKQEGKRTVSRRAAEPSAPSRRTHRSTTKRREGTSPLRPPAPRRNLRRLKSCNVKVEEGTQDVNRTTGPREGDVVLAGNGPDVARVRLLGEEVALAVHLRSVAFRKGAGWILGVRCRERTSSHGVHHVSQSHPKPPVSDVCVHRRAPQARLALLFYRGNAFVPKMWTLGRLRERASSSLGRQ